MASRRVTPRQVSIDISKLSDRGSFSDASKLPRQESLYEPLETNMSRNDDAEIISTKLSPFVIQITAIAGLGGILFGYDLGVISSALPQMTLVFNLTNTQQEIAVSILYLGGGFGAALGGSLCDAFGRKRAILLTDFFFLLGALVLYAAPSFVFICIGRIIVGFAVAVSGIADVSYLHEIAPVQWRGSIVSVNEACISLGFLLAFMVGSLFSAEGNESGWRVMFGFSGLIALVQLVGMWNMPESPVWLKEQGRLEESEAALQRIDGGYDRCFGRSEGAEVILPSSKKKQCYDSVTTLETFSSSLAPKQLAEGSCSGGRCCCVACYNQTVFLSQPLHVFVRDVAIRYKKQAYIALFLALTQQFCGQTNVLSYAPLIFADASGHSDSSFSFIRGWSMLSIGLVKFIVTVIVIWKIESIGRRVLLLLGMTTIAIGLLLLTAAFAGTPPADTQVVEENTWGFALAMPGVLLVVCGYSMSFGPLTWLLTSEMFPADIRGRALGASTIVTYLGAALVTCTFLSAQAWAGPTFVFATYGLITTFGLIFAFLAIPDTKESTEAEIEADLNNMFCWKQHLRCDDDLSSPDDQTPTEKQTYVEYNMP